MLNKTIVHVYSKATLKKNRLYCHMTGLVESCAGTNPIHSFAFSCFMPCRCLSVRVEALLSLNLDDELNWRNLLW